MSLKTVLAVTVLVLGAGALTGQDKKFDSKDGKFSAKFPLEPKVVPQKAGGLDLYITIAEKDKDKDKVGFAVIYTDLPADVVKSSPGKKLLEGGAKGLEDNFKAKIVSSSETVFKANGKDYPARDLVAEKESLTLRVRIIMVDARLYQVFVIGSKEQATGKEADEFLKSFELAK
ncbi:hypothetical protein GobsT_00640 [Gemmata obscuriglobus]|uniref:PsbP C-terminal domain-containing protein n=1 Tax=Gemmata obscuriglobus TaxID=114 RepID=A0A2Z3H8V1_9BACT|nr:hypothetical protein [Gemmata obscuriglobus]AWM41311.1 hypothetical protein C1280_32820 [Gemmata obscuriglobus]QEG25339.1 hypothetical protein GobsT_00640 [Gemmata obscuriglobus]VTR98279.1 Uncharacterized protein OS=Tolypothrix bouteillei VB521301 GN=DA73_93680 PE=4 SV=1 [Gemmata obscuriglobus UQM 2246]